MKPFPIDYTIDKIIKEIIDEVLLETGTEVTYDTVVKIIEQQSISTAEGMAQGHTILWKYFGSFVATKKRVDALNKRYIKMGLKPNLEDRGFYRVSFDKTGNEYTSQFEANRKADYSTQGDYKAKFNPVDENI